MTDVSRRSFLKAVSLSGLALATGSGIKTVFDNKTDTQGIAARTDFFGATQAGITTAQQEFGVVVVLDVIDTNRNDLRELFRELTSEIENLTQAKKIPSRPGRFPPTDNLIYVPNPNPENLTITVGVGASLFDKRFGLANKKPKELIPMPRFFNDRLQPGLSHGDVVLQICSDTQETTLRALRLLMKKTRKHLTLRWMVDGFAKPNTLPTGRTSTRNLLGFKDGTANIAGQPELVQRNVWINNNDWTKNGTFMAVRTIRMMVEHWDRTSLNEQEAIFGRKKDTGAPIGQSKESDIPIFHPAPVTGQIPMDAHVRLANPRTKQTEKSLILRRGYNYANGFDDAGQLDQGLLFISYQNSLENGFTAVQKRLDGEPLEEYIRPIGGGFFFMFPGVKNSSDYFGKGLLG